MHEFPHIKQDSEGVTDLIVRHQKIVMDTMKKDGTSPILIAVQKNAANCVRLLIAAGAPYLEVRDGAVNSLVGRTIAG